MHKSIRYFILLFVLFFSSAEEVEAAHIVTGGELYLRVSEDSDLAGNAAFMNSPMLLYRDCNTNW